MEQLRAALQSARRPLLMLGGTVWTPQACADMTAFAERAELPVTCAFRFQDVNDNRRGNYVGDVGIGINPRLARRVRDADMLLLVGPRLGEMTTSGYSLVEAPRPRQRLIHVHAGALELGRVYQGELLINAGMPQFAAAAAQLQIDGGAWSERLTSARADYMEWNDKPTAIPGKVQMAEVIAWLRERLPADSILTTGSGNFTGFVQRYYRFTGVRTQVGSTNGSMVYGVEETAQLASAFERCLAAGRPALIEVRIDSQAITTSTTLDSIRLLAQDDASLIGRAGTGRVPLPSAATTHGIRLWR